MKQNKCLNCNRKVTRNAKWCHTDCKKQFLLNHYSADQCAGWFRENEIARFEREAAHSLQVNEETEAEIVQFDKQEVSDMVYFLEDYLLFFKKRKSHKNLDCDTCRLAREFLKKLRE